MAGCGAGSMSWWGQGPVVGGDVAGALVVAQEGEAVRRGPQIAAGLERGVGPGGMGLEPVMPPAERRQVAGAGGAAAGVFPDVVVVGMSGRTGAVVEHA